MKPFIVDVPNFYRTIGQSPRCPIVLV